MLSLINFYNSLLIFFKYFSILFLYKFRKFICNILKILISTFRFIKDLIFFLLFKFEEIQNLMYIYIYENFILIMVILIIFYKYLKNIFKLQKKKIFTMLE